MQGKLDLSHDACHFTDSLGLGLVNQLSRPGTNFEVQMIQNLHDRLRLPTTYNRIFIYCHVLIFPRTMGWNM